MKVVDVFSQRRILVWFFNYTAVCCIFVEREWLWKIYYTFAVFFNIFGCGIMFYSAVVYMNDIERLAVISHHVMLVIDVLVGTTIFFCKRKTMRSLFKGMSNSFDYESQLVSHFLDDLQEKREKSMKKIFKYIMFTACFMQMNLIIWAFVEKYTRNMDFMLLFPCWFPFDLSYLPYHIMAYFWQNVLILFIIFITSGALCIIYLVYSHLSSQIVLLKFAIEKSKARAYEFACSNLEETVMDTLDDRMRKSYVKGTIQCVKHHLMIIDYYEASKDIFKFIYLMMFITGIILLTSTGFALISDNFSLKIKFVGVNAIQMSYMYIFCLVGEKISEMGESIRFSIYGIEWYEMPKECQSSLKLMVERTLRPFEFFTLTGQKADLDNFMAMVKASYSYFNMMLAMQQN